MATSAGGMTSALRDQPTRLDGVFDGLRKRVASGALPAAALAIGDADGEIRSDSFAVDGPPPSRQSYFFLASVTKPVFASAFMRLVEDGLLALDDPIGRWLPQFAAGDKQLVTARHVLSHTSGVADVAPEMIVRRRMSAARMTQIVLDAPLRFAPGTRYEYGSASFYLLAQLIEQLTGTGYVEFLQRSVLQPLGMQATFDPRRAGRPIVAVEGVGIDNRLVRFLTLRHLARAALPGGGLFGTLDDLLRFGAALLRPAHDGQRHVPLAPHTIAQMGEDQLRGLPGMYDGEERPVHFGLAWGKPTLMRDLPGSTRVISHGGATGTRLWIDPEVGLVFVFFTNSWAPDRSTEVEALRGTYLALEGR